MFASDCLAVICSLLNAHSNIIQINKLRIQLCYDNIYLFSIIVIVMMIYIRYIDGNKRWILHCVRNSDEHLAFDSVFFPTLVRSSFLQTIVSAFKLIRFVTFRRLFDAINDVNETNAERKKEREFPHDATFNDIISTDLPQIYKHTHTHTHAVIQQLDGWIMIKIMMTIIWVRWGQKRQLFISSVQCVGSK